MRIAALSLVLLLAGCSQPTPDDPAIVPAEPATVLDVWAVDELFVMETEAEDTWPRVWYLFPNETVRDIHFLVTFDQVPDGDWTVVVELTCTGYAGEECSTGLAPFRGPSPLAIDAVGLDLPWGAGLQMTMRAEGGLQAAGAVMGPAYNYQALVMDNWPWLKGTLNVERQVAEAKPEADWPVVTITDGFDGNTALCVITTKDCPATPSGNMRYVTEPVGRIRDVTIRVEWDAVGPATEELYIWLQCTFTCEGADSGEQLTQVRGTSPLEVRLDQPRWPVGGAFEILIVEGSLRTVVPTFTYQPYHVDYTYSVAVDPRYVPE